MKRETPFNYTGKREEKKELENMKIAVYIGL